VPPARRTAAPFPRLPGIDPRALRAGVYTDVYFLNSARILERLARERRPHRGGAPAARPPFHPPGRFLPGRAEVEMQFFARRAPRFVAAGVEVALGLLADGAIPPGGPRPGRGAGLRVRAVPEGSLVPPGRPVLTVRGRYTSFAHLETPLLGVLTRAGRIATNVYETVVAARGKPVLFFPARFDLPQTQPLDGLAYRAALDAYRRRSGRVVPAYVSTDAQGLLWGGAGVGTVPHAYVLCFLGDAVEGMLAFCRTMPAGVRRVALVDTTNDCVGESVRIARRLFEEHLRHARAGRGAEAERYLLYGVRADTGADLRDRSVPPSSDPRLERGVNPVLIRLIRQALDRVPGDLPLPVRERQRAETYFRAIRIVATGGFDPERIRFFERRGAPVDIYGVGSYLLRGPACDYTADVVRVRVGRRFRVVAKTGRHPRRNALLRRVRLA
jgi:nicotinate phosphoribosyltransferase